MAFPEILEVVRIKTGERKVAYKEISKGGGGREVPRIGSRRKMAIRATRQKTSGIIHGIKVPISQTAAQITLGRHISAARLPVSYPANDCGGIFSPSSFYEIPPEVRNGSSLIVLLLFWPSICHILTTKGKSDGKVAFH